MQFWRVYVVPRYLKSTTSSKDLFSIFVLLICVWGGFCAVRAVFDTKTSSHLFEIEPFIISGTLNGRQTAAVLFCRIYDKTRSIYHSLERPTTRNGSLCSHLGGSV
jgi:hypothetical protein